MPMHPHAKPNFRNLFWYPFKITLITALRTFPFFGKLLGKRLDWATTTPNIQNSSMPVVNLGLQRPPNLMTSPLKGLPQTESLRTCSRHSGSHKRFNTLTNDLRRWNLGFSFLGITTVELELFGKHVLHVNCA